MSLRAELIAGGESLPDFALLLPEGWIAQDAAFADADARVEERLAGLPPERRAAARTGITGLLRSAQAEAEKADVIRTFAPSATDPEEAVPVSLVASWLTAPAGGTVAELGADAVRRFAARPLDPEGTILTWALDESTVVDEVALDVAGHAYLLRAPGQERKGLLFRSVILRAVGEDRIPDDGIAAMVAVCDAIVASVRWRRDA